MTANAQPRNVFETSGYVARIWTSADGLPQNSGNALLQTTNGYIWIGTDSGVVRFDGLRFVKLNLPPTGLPAHEISALAEDQTGALWIGTRGAGLFRYANNEFLHLTTDHGLPSDLVKVVDTSEGGTVFVGTDAGYAAVRADSIAWSGLYDEWVSDLLRLPSGVRYAATTAGLQRITRTEAVVIPFPDAQREQVNALATDRAGTIWVGTNSGLFVYRDGRLTRHSDPTMANATVTALVHTPPGAADQHLWVSLASGELIELRGESTEVLATGLPGRMSFAGALLVDREFNLWAGTLGYGVLRYRRKLINHVGEGVVRPIIETSAGEILIGNREGVFRLHGGDTEPMLQDDGEPMRNSYSLAEDQQGRIWAGTSDGVFTWSPAGFTRPSATAQLRRAIAVQPTRDGAIWIGSISEGLFRLKEGRLFKFGPDEGLPNSAVRAIHEDTAGRIWVGTDGGLVTVAGNKLEQTSVSETAVLSVVPDRERDDVLWIGTGNGLYRLVDGEATRVYYEWGRLDDGAGYLWTVSGTGIVRIPKSDLHDVAGGADVVVRAAHFGADIGFEGEGNGGFQPAALKRSDGTLWFPTTSGAATIDPATVPKHVPPPLAVIESLAADGDDLAPADAAEVPPTHRRLTIRYTGISMSAPDDLTFRYILEGHDRDWFEAYDVRSASYTNVPPGNYTFTVVATDANGASSQPSKIRVVVPARFYETTWFTALATGTAILAVVALFVIRGRRAERREDELHVVVGERTRELQDAVSANKAARALAERQAEELREIDVDRRRLFANVSHELRTPLSLILGPLDQVLKHDGLPDESRGLLKTAHSQGERLLDMITQLLELSKLDADRMRFSPESADLTDIVARVVASFGPVAQNRDIRLLFEPEEAQLTGNFDSEKLERVFYNLIDNALKFTEVGGKVSVRIDTTGEVANVVVRDTGCGISPDAQPRVFDRFFQGDASSTRAYGGTGIGLALARELVEMHNGSLSVESQVGFGSTFTARLPFKTRKPKPAPPRPTTAASPRDGETAARREPRQPNAPTTDRPTVLVVEDNPDMLSFVGSTLRDTFSVVTAADGGAALEVLSRVKPDIVLSDVMMPGMNGFELCRRIKETPEWHDLPVVLLTAKASDSSHLDGLATGADDYIVKPFNADVLRARLVSLVERRATLRREYSTQITLQPSNVQLESDDAAFIEKAKSIVESQMGEARFSVEQLADSLAVSTRQLQRRLRDLTDESPSEFIRSMRLTRAHQMLTQQHGTVSEVAYAVGYTSVSQFSKRYKERFGELPSAVRASGS